MNDIKAQQALSVLDAIETGLRCGSTIQSIRADGELFALIAADAHDRTSRHYGVSLLDALAQYAQAVVVEQEPWGEPSLLDAESDEEAFDRAVGS